MKSKSAGLTVALFVAGSLAVPHHLGASAHGQGQLKLETTNLTPGMALHLTGAKFPKGESFDVLLAGPSGRTQLKHIMADADGAFHDFVIVPEGLPPGSYRIVLIASDDDEVATADVQLAAGPAAANPVMGMAGHDMSKMGASADPLALPRARSPWVTGGAVLAIGFALVIGAAAVLRSPAV
jgi:hypothetical protein